jgi:hypothetical protein
MSLSVIGAGFGRTGTLSLKQALEELGVGPCYHMMEVIKKPGGAAQWEAVADGKALDWEDVFDGFRSTVDWPSATYYRELAEAFPDAKVILSLRDPESWFASTQATIFKQAFDDPNDQFSRMASKVIGRLFDHRMHDKAHVIGVYNRHNETVQQVIPADRLLVYNVAEGWSPLCAFLGVPVPEGPMPKVNSTEEFLAGHEQIMAAIKAQQSA